MNISWWYWIVTFKLLTGLLSQVKESHVPINFSQEISFGYFIYVCLMAHVLFGYLPMRWRLLNTKDHAGNLQRRPNLR